jgi:hypothetical protein
MAREPEPIKITLATSYCVVTISEPDEDGEVIWTSSCGQNSSDWGYQALADTIGDAGVHLEHRCTQRPT